MNVAVSMSMSAVAVAVVVSMVMVMVTMVVMIVVVVMIVDGHGGDAFRSVDRRSPYRRMRPFATSSHLAAHGLSDEGSS
jgi:lipopolysaccharide/colanic/teichoic acid biosynthesis glycosyltransferase